MDIADVDLEAARARVGDTFRLAIDDGAFDVELVEATAFRPGAADEQHNFSMVFRGPQSPVVPQATRRLHHEAWGDVDVFLVPVGQDDDGTYYETVINRQP